jgi:hypothetical protein
MTDLGRRIGCEIFPSIIFAFSDYSFLEGSGFFPIRLESVGILGTKVDKPGTEGESFQSDMTFTFVSKPGFCNFSTL